jgi:hypothetical protein
MQYEPGPGVVASRELLLVVHRADVPKPHEGIEEYFESDWRPVASGSA